MSDSHTNFAVKISSASVLTDECGGGRELLYMIKQYYLCRASKAHTHTFREIFETKIEPFEGKYTDSSLWDWDRRFQYVYDRIDCVSTELITAVTDHYAENMKVHPKMQDAFKDHTKQMHKKEELR